MASTRHPPLDDLALRTRRRERVHKLHCYAAADRATCTGAAKHCLSSGDGGWAFGFCVIAPLVVAGARWFARCRRAAVAFLCAAGRPLVPLLNPNARCLLFGTVSVSFLFGMLSTSSTLAYLSGNMTSAMSEAAEGLEDEYDSQGVCHAERESDRGFMWRMKLVSVVYLAVYVDSVLDIKSPLRHALLRCL